LQLLLLILLLLAKHFLLLDLALQDSFVAAADFPLGYFLLLEHLLSHEFSPLVP